jgi:F-type H+-transporting ATPase subunit b
MNLNPLTQIEPVTIGATVLIFAATYRVMRTSVFLPIVNAMEDRQERIDAGRRAAEEAEQLVCAAEAEAAERLKLAHLEGDRLVQAAREKAERAREERAAAAEAEAVRILEAGRAKITAAREHEVAALRAQALDCVGLACSKLLVPIEDKTVEAIVDTAIAKNIH